MWSIGVFSGYFFDKPFADVKKIFEDSELQEDSVIRKIRITAADGKSYSTNHYSLEMIIAVGFKVNSERAVQFRKWVNQIAKDYTIKGYANDDIDTVMKIWLDTNIQAHDFISADYWKCNFDMVKEILPQAEIYVHEDDGTKQIDGFIGLNDTYIEGIFVKKAAQSKGIGKHLLGYAKEVKSTLRLSVYQKNEKAIQFYLREKFCSQAECVDENTGEKELIMVWAR